MCAQKLKSALSDGMRAANEVYRWLLAPTHKWRYPVPAARAGIPPRVHRCSSGLWLDVFQLTAVAETSARVVSRLFPRAAITLWNSRFVMRTAVRRSCARTTRPETSNLIDRTFCGWTGHEIDSSTFFPTGSDRPASKRIPPPPRSTVVPIPTSMTLRPVCSVQRSSNAMSYRRWKRLSPLMRSIGSVSSAVAVFVFIVVRPLHTGPSMRSVKACW